MSVADRMAARLATTSPDEQGSPCFSCGETALACQHHFVLTDEWCCYGCRTRGGEDAHR